MSLPAPSLCQILNQKLKDLSASPLKLVIALTPIEINVLKFFIIHSPESINTIMFKIKKILRQGRIDVHDIPEIVLLITDVYKTQIAQHDMDIVNIAGVVKFTADALLHSGVFPLPEIEIEILQKLLDSSIALLKTSPNLPVSIEKCCFQIF